MPRDSTDYPVAAPAHEPEQFVMREPAPDILEGRSKAFKDQFHAWDVLGDTIRRYGGEVHVVPPAAIHSSAWRSSMFVRDPAFILHMDDDEPIVFGSKHDSIGMKMEFEAIRRAMGDHAHYHINGVVDGGNLVFDPARNVLFWGMGNEDFLRYKEARGDEYHPSWRSAEDRARKEQADKKRFGRKQTQALQHAGETLHGLPELKKDGNDFRIVLMPIPDVHAQEFYHLDGMLGMLPSGEAVVCKQLLSKTALAHLSETIDSQRIIDISPEDARKGATNFITVGKHIITPYASNALKEKFNALGYEVTDPPAVGLPDDAWMFAPMGGVRCAVLKTTRDRGYPAPTAHEKTAPYEGRG